MVPVCRRRGCRDQENRSDRWGDNLAGPTRGSARGCAAIDGRSATLDSSGRRSPRGECSGPPNWPYFGSNCRSASRGGSPSSSWPLPRRIRSVIDPSISLDEQRTRTFLQRGRPIDSEWSGGGKRSRGRLIGMSSTWRARKRASGPLNHACRSPPPVNVITLRSRLRRIMVLEVPGREPGAAIELARVSSWRLFPQKKTREYQAPPRDHCHQHHGRRDPAKLRAQESPLGCTACGRH